MIIGVLSRKGGVGKTTLSMHFAGILATSMATMLVDEDDTRNATNWAKRGEMAFTLVGMQAVAREASRHAATVVDSRGGMPLQDMQDLYDNSDRIVVPVAPEFMVMDTLVQTANVLRVVDPELRKLRVVMTMARPGRKLEDAFEALGSVGLRPIDQTIRHCEAFKDATEQGVLVNKVKGNKLAGCCWTDCERALKAVLA